MAGTAKRGDLECVEKNRNTCSYILLIDTPKSSELTTLNLKQ